MSNARATKATGKSTKPEGPLGDGGPPVSVFDKVYARCEVGCAELHRVASWRWVQG
jgi:hypothetical protein